MANNLLSDRNRVMTRPSPHRFPNAARCNACPDLVRRDIPRHYGPHPHERTGADAAVLPQQCTCTDVGTPADMDATAQENTGCQSGEVADDVVAG